MTLSDWLNGSALPLWWEKGADRVLGGFFEVLDRSAEPTNAPRRARVIGRQIYVYASAEIALGQPKWLGAAKHGLDFMVSHFMRDDGLIRPTLDAQGVPMAGELKLYDQAFCLFALAAAASAGVGAAHEFQLGRLEGYEAAIELLKGPQ